MYWPSGLIRKLTFSGFLKNSFISMVLGTVANVALVCAWVEAALKQSERASNGVNDRAIGGVWFLVGVPKVIDSGRIVALVT
jgi:hypothetical protein